jgi:hypothetical protein
MFWCQIVWLTYPVDSDSYVRMLGLAPTLVECTNEEEKLLL